MPLIDGVGDEVVEFVVVVLVVVVAALAWWSTNARPVRYRTVLVMRNRSHHPVTVSIRTRPNTTVVTNTHVRGSSQDLVVASTSAPPNNNTNSTLIPLQEMDSIVDADMAMMDNNRLHFYRRIDLAPGSNTTTAESTSDESEPPSESEAATNAQIREMDSIVSAMEADVADGCDLFNRNTERNASTSVKKSDSRENKENESAASSTSNTDSNQNIENANEDDENTVSNDTSPSRILIKLKYLNDTLKEVEGCLDELLKDFKWRHFSSELSSACRVRLIFNGRVLVDEAATLRACGLHHRAVVHCLVHPNRGVHQQQRGTVPSGEEGGATLSGPHEVLTEGAPVERAWDLENILMTLISVALTVVWFFRCEYSNLFTASASVALFGLTVFYSVAVFGLYLSEAFHFDIRTPVTQSPAQAQAQSQPQPANQN